MIEPDGQLQVEEVQNIFLQISRYLAALHQHGLLHLDLTPRNIFIKPDHTIAISDPGLARIMINTGLTLTGYPINKSLTFLSPEQGMYDSNTSATDVYQCGVLMFRLLTGGYPRKIDTIEEFMQLCCMPEQNQASCLPSLSVAQNNNIILIPQYFDELVNRCLSINPQHRPADGTELLSILEDSPHFDENACAYPSLDKEG